MDATMRNTGKRVFTSGYGWLDVWLGVYQTNGAMAVQLKRVKAPYRPVAILSVNTDDSRDLPRGCFYAKTYSENSGIARDALLSGWFKVRDDLEQHRSGYVVLPVWELLAEKEKLLDEPEPRREPVPAQREDEPTAAPMTGLDALLAGTAVDAGPEMPPTSPRFESDGGGDFGGGGASGSWSDSPAPASSSSSDSSSSSPSSDSGGGSSGSE